MTPLNYTRLKELVIAFEELLQDEQLTEPEHELTGQIYGDMVNLQVLAEN